MFAEPARLLDGRRANELGAPAQVEGYFILLYFTLFFTPQCRQGSSSSSTNTKCNLSALFEQLQLEVITHKHRGEPFEGNLRTQLRNQLRD